MIERRASPRRRTYLGALATTETPRSTDDCLVRDLTGEGARIVFSGLTPIPNAFDLAIRERGEMRRARVVWRSDLQAGVAFEGEPRLAQEAARRIRRLEIERDALSRRLSEIEPTR